MILRLNVEERKGKTVAKNVYFQGAFKVMRPVYHDDSGQVCYYIIKSWWRIFRWRSLSNEISLGEHAKLTLTTQSATKIYKTPKYHAYQETEIFLKQVVFLSIFLIR